jgi:hypothetical protein
MTAYQEFCKTRRVQLLETFPEYSKKTIKHMISDEWKQQKGAGASITARNSTLRYEVIKTFIQRVPKFDISVSKEICDIVNSKSCSYCKKELKRKSTGDHFMPVVANFKTPILSNFSFLTVPCCSECNSSKTNKKWNNFAEKNKTSEEQKEKLQYLEDFIVTHIKYYRVEQHKYDELLQYMEKSLEYIRRTSEEIPIVEIDKLTLDDQEKI